VFTLAQRREIKKIAKSRPAEHGLPFSRWSLAWKQSTDPDYAAKKARVEHLYALADGEAAAGPGDPDVVVCVDLCRYRDYADVLTVGVCP
jgi:hypothetical protein